jgi:plasmid stabilization system protein ParE
MIKKVFWNKEAVESLQDSYDFIGNSSTKKAEEFIDKVDSLISMLQTFPDIGRRSKKFKPVRQCRIDKYRKMYYSKTKFTLIIIYFHDDRKNPSTNSY